MKCYDAKIYNQWAVQVQGQTVISQCIHCVKSKLAIQRPMGPIISVSMVATLETADQQSPITTKCSQ